tara:strand:+ start:98 stop:505 length:408 start_codon:yes stop_codon:yes gene_type:complete
VKMRVIRGQEETAIKLFPSFIASFLNVTDKDKVIITIKEDNLTRSGRQNDLFWVWMTVLGEFHGHNKAEMAEVLQQSILGETSFVSKLDGAKINKQERAKYLTVGKFKNFLEQIEIHAAEFGVRLPSEEEIDSDR